MEHDDMGKKKLIAIDADHILYAIASPESEKNKRTMKGKDVSKKVALKVEVKNLKIKFMDVVHEYERRAQAKAKEHGWKLGKTIVVIGDASNFRYDIFPEYKANRKGRPTTKAFKKLRKWARKEFAPGENIEADDKVAWYVERGAIGFSGDKDLLDGVEGMWFDCYYSRKGWKVTTKAMAREFNLIQYVMGDLDDNIQGIHLVGKVKARALLDKHGWDWNGVMLSYQEKGCTVEDAILTRQLISMKQWSPKKGVVLFNGVEK